MKKKVISLLLSIMLVVTLTPSIAFADNDDAENQTSGGSVKVAAPAEMTLKTADGDLSLDLSMQQAKVNERNVTVSIPAMQDLIKDEAFDEINVEATLSYGGKAVRTGNFTKKANEFAGGENSFQIELSDFGKWNMDFTLMKDGKEIAKSSGDVPVIAENYNITVMCATLPVLILTLKSIGDALPEGPLVLAVERYWSFDWDNLPDDIYANPFWDGRGYEQATTKAYAEMLYEISPDSHFYFYFNDYWIERDFVNVLWKNSKIPENNYSVRFITDGTATYAAFNKVYGNEDDALAKHAEMVEEVKTLKEKALNGESVDFEHMKYGKLSHYCYALLDVEKDAQWWVVRKSTSDTFAVKDAAFAAQFGSDTRITSNYINNLLKAVQDQGKEDVFRNLYKFDDEAFDATRAKGKKIMMVLGTSKAGETNVPIENYVKLTQAYYGDEYEYYYKGHPGYVPELNPGRKEALEEMGFQILDSSIAAEIFLFFDPDIVLSGYQSSTFASASGTQGCLFNTSKAEAEAASIPYEEMGMIYATDMTTKDVADEQTKALIKKPDHHNYFIEFSDTTQYDYGVFDADTEELYYIKDGKLIVEPTIKLSASKYVYNGKAKKPAVTVEVDGNVLQEDTYDVTYSDGRKQVGQYDVTVTLKGKYEGSATKAFKIVPKKPIIAKATVGKKKVTIKMKTQVSRTGGKIYQIAYKVKGAKKWKYTTTSKQSKVIKKLKKGKKYQIKVRAYKKIGKTKYYGAWSKIRTTKKIK